MVTNEETEQFETWCRIVDGGLRELENFVRSGGDLEIRNGVGEFLLHGAVEENDRRMLLRLLELGADPNSQADDWGTPLHTAAAYGRHARLRELLAAGSSPTAHLRNGYSPLHLAAMQVGRNTRRNITTLVSAGAPIDEAIGEQQATPLHFAVNVGNVHGAITLLDLGANPSCRTHLGDSPFDMIDWPETLERIQLWTSEFRSRSPRRSESLLRLLKRKMRSGNMRPPNQSIRESGNG